MGREKKEGKTEIQKVEWKRTKRFFLDEIKSIGHNYLGAVIWQKKKKKKKKKKMKNSGHKL